MRRAALAAIAILLAGCAKGPEPVTFTENNCHRVPTGDIRNVSRSTGVCLAWAKLNNGARMCRLYQRKSVPQHSVMLTCKRVYWRDEGAL